MAARGDSIPPREWRGRPFRRRQWTLVHIFPETDFRQIMPASWNATERRQILSIEVRPSFSRRLIGRSAQAGRPHVGPHFIDIFEAFGLAALLAGRSPPLRDLLAARPDRILLLGVDDHQVDFSVFFFVGWHASCTKIVTPTRREDQCAIAPRIQYRRNRLSHAHLNGAGLSFKKAWPLRIRVVAVFLYATKKLT